MSEKATDTKRLPMIGDKDFRMIWQKLEVCFQGLVSVLRTEFPDLWANIRWHQTARFPFTGYTSLLACYDPARTEDCVLMMSVERTDESLVVACDVLTGSGELLAACPKFEIDTRQSKVGQIEHLERAEEEAERFFTENLDEVRRALLKAEDQ